MISIPLNFLTWMRTDPSGSQRYSCAVSGASALRKWALVAFGVAVAVRWGVLAVWFWDLPIVEPGAPLNDNLYYHGSANLLAEGKGFVNPFLDRATPTAAHPPGFTVFLSMFSVLGIDSVGGHRLAAGALSASVVFPTGLLLQRAFGLRAALVGMAIAAAHPPLWMNDSLILSESLAIPAAAWGLYASHRTWEDPSLRSVLILSITLTVGAYTRSESALLYLLLLVPLVGFHPNLAWRARVERVGAAAVCALVLLAPWLIRNAVSFDEPVYLSSGAGYVVEIGNCDRTYSGNFLGYWHSDCDDGSAWPDGDESVVGAAKLERGREYIRAHLTEQPKVVAARIGRMFGFYRPLQSLDFDIFLERRERLHANIGLVSHYLMMALAAFSVPLWRRRTSLIPPLAMIASVVMAAAASFGISRYRVIADVALVVLAAAGIERLLQLCAARRSAQVVREPLG